MKFSILTPTIAGTEKGAYRLDMLELALHSVFIQKHQDYEIIVRDAGMLDLTKAGLLQNGLKEGKIRYVAGKDGGITAALNDCLALARGDIIVEMNDDDMLYERDALSDVAQVFADNPDTEWLYGRMVCVNETGTVVGGMGERTTLSSMLERGNSVCQPTVFWRRSLMQRVGMFDERHPFAQDYDMWIRLWQESEPIYLDEVLAVYRYHPGMATKMESVAQAADAEAVKQKYRI